MCAVGTGVVGNDGAGRDGAGERRASESIERYEVAFRSSDVVDNLKKDL